MTVEYWTTADAMSGLCELEDVGDIRETERVEPQAGADASNAPPPVLMTREERRAKLQSLADKIIIHAEAHPEAMLDDNGAQINKLLEMFTRIDEKEEEIKVRKANISDFTPEELEQAVLAVMGLGPENASD